MCEPGPVKSLALLCLQSNRYVEDLEYRDAVDTILNDPKYDAAPELLEALEGLSPRQTGYGPSMDWNAYNEAQRKARAATAKARGTNNG